MLKVCIKTNKTALLSFMLLLGDQLNSNSNTELKTRLLQWSDLFLA